MYRDMVDAVKGRLEELETQGVIALPEDEEARSRVARELLDAALDWNAEEEDEEEPLE